MADERKMKIDQMLKHAMDKSSGYLIPEDPKLYREIIKKFVSHFESKKFDKVVAIDMKGLMYGPTVAYELKIPFIPIIKSGKVNKQFVVRKGFTDYSKNKKSIEIGIGSLAKGDNVLLIDDVFETGNTGKAAIYLIEKLKAKVKGIGIIINKLNKEDETFFNKYGFYYITKQ